MDDRPNSGPLSPRDTALHSWLRPEVAREYERVCATFAKRTQLLYSPYGSCLQISDILRAHFLIANHFLVEGYGIGGIGPRDDALLESAAYRQVVSLDGKAKWQDWHEICATLFYGLIMGHAFHDANKRTAFLSLLYQLQIQGWCPSVDQKEFEDFTVDIADHRLQSHRKFPEFASRYPDEHDVKYIGYWIRRHIRKIDNNERTISFRELKSILNRYGYTLDNPHGNRIDVVLLRQCGESSPKEMEEVRVGQMGFPSWSKQVSKGDLKAVRELTGLTPDAGVDAAAFFDGLDPMQKLITTYHEPLLRLANR